MTDFKVGDRVRTEDGEGEITEVLFDAQTNEPAYEVAIPGENNWYFSGDELGLVTETPSQNFAKTAAKFATDPLSTEDIESLTTLGEQLGISSFEQSVHRVTGKIADLLIAKNKSYGDAALNPVRIFSKASRIEQLNVRIDDKISRIQRGTDFGDEDTVRDLIGYLVLRLIAEESE